MKNKFCLWNLPVAAFVTAALFFACDNGTADNTGDTNNLGITIMDKRYETAPYNSAEDESGGLVYSAYDDTGNYYLFLLGKVKYVPVAASAYLHFNGGTPVKITYSRSQFEKVTITESLQIAVSHSVTTGASTTISLTAKEGFGIGPFEASIQGNVSQKWSRDETESRSFTSTYTTETVKGFEEKFEFTSAIGEHGEPAGLYRYAFFTTTDVFYVVKTNRAQTAITESYIALCNRPGGGWYLDYAPGYEATFGKTAPGDLLKIPDISAAGLPPPQTEIIPPRDNWTETRSGDGNRDIDGIADAPVKETFQPDLPIAELRELGYREVTITVDFRYKAAIFFSLVPVHLRLQIADSLGTNTFMQKDFDHYPDWTGNSLSVTVLITALKSDTGAFTLIWNRPESGVTHTPFSVGRRTVTIQASK
jgi:hypothetical protein